MLPGEVPPLPAMGEYQGKAISIEHARATLTPEQLAEVIVDVPGRGRIRPWRFVGQGVREAPGGGLEID